GHPRRSPGAWLARASTHSITPDRGGRGSPEAILRGGSLAAIPPRVAVLHAGGEVLRVAQRAQHDVRGAAVGGGVAPELAVDALDLAADVAGEIGGELRAFGGAGRQLHRDAQAGVFVGVAGHLEHELAGDVACDGGLLQRRSDVLRVHVRAVEGDGEARAAENVHEGELAPGLTLTRDIDARCREPRGEHLGWEEPAAIEDPVAEEGRAPVPREGELAVGALEIAMTRIVLSQRWQLRRAK